MHIQNLLVYMRNHVKLLRIKKRIHLMWILFSMWFICSSPNTWISPLFLYISNKYVIIPMIPIIPIFVINNSLFVPVVINIFNSITIIVIIINGIIVFDTFFNILCIWILVFSLSRLVLLSLMLILRLWLQLMFRNRVLCLICLVIISLVCLIGHLGVVLL